MRPPYDGDRALFLASMLFWFAVVLLAALAVCLIIWVL